MRFEVTFKCPDALYDATSELGEWDEHDNFIPISDEEREEIIDRCSTFVKYSEYITVEFSDEDGELTARVVPC